MPVPIIRPARPDECHVLTSLALRSKAHWGYSDEFMRACIDELTITARRIQDEHYLVAEIDGRICGMAGIARDGDGWEVCNMFVDPGRIGTGTGRLLFERLLDLARAKGITELGIDADPNARPFYERMGAEFRHMTPSDSIPGREIPHLSLTL